MHEILIRQISITSVSFLNLAITIWYCWLTYKQKIKPALAMWIFFTIAVAISLIIAYFPVLSRLWKTKKNGESFLIWTGMLLAPLLSLISSKGTLATIYSVRAIVCISLLMLLMVRVEYITKKQFVRDQN